MAIGTLVGEMYVIDKRIVLGVGDRTILIGVGCELHRIAHCRIGRIVVGTRGRTRLGAHIELASLDLHHIVEQTTDDGALRFGQ